MEHPYYTHFSIHGLREPDDEWAKKLNVWNACNDAGIDPPKEVSEFFDYHKNPNELEGLEVDIPASSVVREIDENGGPVVDLKAIPEGVRYIQIHISW